MGPQQPRQFFDAVSRAPQIVFEKITEVLVVFDNKNRLGHSGWIPL
jgi:hypothetical protein